MILTPDKITEFREKRYNATVLHRELLHSDLMVIRIKPDFPRPNYEGGQYCTLGLANFEPRAAGCQHEHLQPDDLLKLVRRSYSISSSVYADGHTLRNPSQDDWLEFYIVLVRENLDGRVPAFTPRLFTLEVGDRLNVGEKIAGHFTLHAVKPEDQVVFLGTGTGEAPHNSMLGELLLREHKGMIINACCVRYAKDLGYLETQYRLMKQFPQYKYLPLTTRENLSEGKMYIQDLITSGELAGHLAERGGSFDPASTHVFLCGNPKMIGIPFKDKETATWKYPSPTGVIEILEGMGFKADNPQLKVEGNIHFEKYW